MAWDLLENKLDIDALELENCTVRTTANNPAANSIPIPTDGLRLYVNKQFKELTDVPAISIADVGKIFKVNSLGTALELSIKPEFYYTGTSPNVTGYAILPTGTIIQWGTCNKTSPSDTSFTTFPITFPNACDCVILTPKLTAVSTTAHWLGHIKGFNPSGVAIEFAGTSVNNDGIKYLAIGY